MDLPDLPRSSCRSSFRPPAPARSGRALRLHSIRSSRTPSCAHGRHGWRGLASRRQKFAHSRRSRGPWRAVGLRCPRSPMSPLTTPTRRSPLCTALARGLPTFTSWPASATPTPGRRATLHCRRRYGSPLRCRRGRALRRCLHLRKPGGRCARARRACCGPTISRSKAATARRCRHRAWRTLHPIHAAANKPAANKIAANEDAMAAELNGPRLAPRSGAAAQLVVFLHGYGADGNDLIEIGRAWQQWLPHAAFVSPHAPEPCGQAPVGRQWFALTFRDPNERWVGVNKAAPLVQGFLDAELARHQLPPSALALVGFSQGTMMALHVGLRRMCAPAAIVGYSGMLVLEGDSDVEGYGHQVRARPPVLLIHGDSDDLIPVQALMHAVQTLAALE